MKAGALNPSCQGHEHNCEAKTPWKTPITAFCLAAGCRSPNSSRASHSPGAAGRPGGQRGPGAGGPRGRGCGEAGAVLFGKAHEREPGEKERRGAPCAARRSRGGCAEAPRGIRTPPHRGTRTRTAGAGPRRVNNTFAHGDTRGRDFVGNLCRQRLNLT